jgi:hypothetical protein
MIVFGFEKREIFLKPLIFFYFIRKYMGKMVGAGAEILTSWSRSRTKMDQLRNTGYGNGTPLVSWSGLKIFNYF